MCKADDIYTFVIKKEEKKEKHRWSLADWFETRDKMRFQDLWLALHTPTPYEFDLGGSYQLDQISGLGSAHALEVYFSAYASIFGLEVRYESGFEDRWLGLFNFRVFGYHDQSTNITLQMGLMNTSNAAYNFNNAIAGFTATFYLGHYFGVEGLYRHYFSSTPNASGVISSGESYQGGAFLDFRVLRIYWDYFSKIVTWNSTTGVVLGSRIYF